MQQAVDAAQVHERAVVGDVLDDALNTAPRRASREAVRARRPRSSRTARADTPRCSACVELMTLNSIVLPRRAWCLDGRRSTASGEEGADALRHGEAPFTSGDDALISRRLERLLEIHPCREPLAFSRDGASRRSRPRGLDRHADEITGLTESARRRRGILERDEALGLEARIYDDEVWSMRTTSAVMTSPMRFLARQAFSTRASTDSGAGADLEKDLETAGETRHGLSLKSLISASCYQRAVGCKKESNEATCAPPSACFYRLLSSRYILSTWSTTSSPSCSRNETPRPPPLERRHLAGGVSLSRSSEHWKGREISMFPCLSTAYPAWHGLPTGQRTLSAPVGKTTVTCRSFGTRRGLAERRAEQATRLDGRYRGLQMHDTTDSSRVYPYILLLRYIRLSRIRPGDFGSAPEGTSAMPPICKAPRFQIVEIDRLPHAGTVPLPRRCPSMAITECYS